MTDDDLAAIVPGRPDIVVFPKAEGGASGCADTLTLRLSINNGTHTTA